MDKQEWELALRELIADTQKTVALCRQMEERASSRWKEGIKSIPTPIRSRQLCYSCKLPWEPDHRCRGKGKRYIIEMHYDSEDDEVHEDATIDAYLEQSDDASDPCALEGQWDGQDDNTCASVVISHSVDDLTLQQSGDNSGDSHVLVPRPDELPMMTMTHLSYF